MKGGVALAIARKELRDILREKTLVVAFVVQLFIAGFSALLLTGLLALSNAEGGIDPSEPIAYVGDGGAVRFMDGLWVQQLSADEAWNRFDDGRVAAIVFEESGDVQTITVVFANGELQTSLIVAALQDAFTEYEDELRASRSDRLDVQLAPVPPPARDAAYEFVYGSLVPLLVLTPVVLAGAIAGDSLAQERRNGTLLVLRSTATPLWVAVGSKLAVPVALVPFQVGLWCLLLAANGFPVAWPALLLMATALAAILAGLGLLLTVMVQDEAVGQAAYAVAVLVVGGSMMLLPRDPLNMMALFAAGVPDAVAWWTLAAMTALALPILALATGVVDRSLRLK